MKLKKMVLENFQGIKRFDLCPDGRNVAVSGDNGSGKTTLYNAFCWLLYGKPSTNEKNYSPMTIGTHNLNHSAEMEIETEDGQKKTIKKVFHEVYKTQRGSAESFFSGYTTDYFLDGVPVREKDYQSTMAALYKDEETAKLLTRYNYFLEDMKVKDRRALLLEVCGNISDEEVIAVNDDLKDLPGILDGKSIEDYSKIVTAEKKKINEELKQIPARIDEAEKGKPNIEAISSFEDAEKTLSELKAQKSELEAKAAADVGGAEIRKQIADLEAEKSKAEMEYCLEANAGEKEFLEKIRDVENARNHKEIESENLKMEISRKKSAYDLHVSDRKRLLEDWKVASEAKWDGDVNCPTCGQPLPPAQIEEAKKRFNVNKANNLERIKAEGEKVSKEVLEKELAEINSLEEAHKSTIEKVDALNRDIENLRSKKPVRVPFDNSDLGKAYIAKLSDLKERLEIENGAADESLHLEVERIEAEIDEIQSILLNITIAKKQDERIKGLEAREKELSAEYEQIERALYLCELFNRRKSEMLTDKINACFSSLKFRLFQEQINGGIADDCEAILNCDGVEVPFKSANNAARINAGLEVIDTLGKYFGFTLPVLTDNAESNNHIRDTKAQQIRLYVSNDKELTIKEV